MKKNLTTVMFRGTKAREEQLIAVIEKYRGTQGALMPVLQEAQEIYGYLPIEVQKIVATRMGISLEEVYGVSTFYSQFVLNPKGEVAIAVCLGTACYLRGGDDIIKEFERQLGIGVNGTTPDGMFSVEAVRCIGCCGLAPAVVVNGEVHGKLETKNVAAIIEKYRKLG